MWRAKFTTPVMGLTTCTTVSHDGYAHVTPPMRVRAIASDFMHADYSASARNHRLYLCSPWIPPGQKAFKKVAWGQLARTAPNDPCMCKGKLSWGRLCQLIRGLYYEGFVDNLDETLEAHRRCTVTTYGTRTSKKPAGTISQSSNTVRDLWYVHPSYFDSSCGLFDLSNLINVCKSNLA